MAELQTNSNTKQDKRSLFTKIADGLVMGGLGLTDPAALSNLNQKIAAQRQQEIAQEIEQERNNIIMAVLKKSLGIDTGSIANQAQPVVLAPEDEQRMGEMASGNQQQQMGQMSHPMGMQQLLQRQQTQVPFISPESLSNPLMGALDPKGMQAEFSKDIGASRDLKAKVAGGYALLPVKKQEKLQASAISLEETMDKKTFDELGTKYGEAGRVAQSMRGLIGYGKAMDEADIPNWQRALVGGNWAQKALQYFPDEVQDKFEPVLGYSSQLVETKVGALPILSGQARYVVDLANEIAKTQAGPGFSPKIRNSLAAQSLRNIMGLVYAIENGLVTARTLEEYGIDRESNPKVSIKNGKIVLPKEATSLLNSVKLTPEQEKDLEGAIDYLLETPPIKQGKFVEEEDPEYQEYLRLIGQ